MQLFGHNVHGTSSDYHPTDRHLHSDWLVSFRVQQTSLSPNSVRAGSHGFVYGRCIARRYAIATNYNAWYGSASKDLIDTTITQIEDGNIDHVMSVLRRLNLDYHPTYENRANYDELVKEAVSLMKGDFELQGTKWDTGPFTRETWLGHWQDDSNYWIVITQLADAGIVQSGENFPKIRDFVVSADFKKITFAGGDQWLHELRLVNKYEALHVWRHLNDGKVWKVNSLHKLIRATSAQRQFTQQSNP